MKEDILELNTLFLKIKAKGWIKSLRNGTTGIGYTFEKLINKDEDQLQKPDFGSIEIKTYRNSSTKRIHLFATVPDGDEEEPLKKVLHEIGYPSKYDKNKLICNITLNSRRITQVGLYKKIIIENDYFRNKLVVKASKNGKDLGLDISWSHNKIRNVINNKIRYLALINADSKIENGVEYFKYQDIHFYQIKGYYTFLNLIDKGFIELSFQLVEKDNGQVKDRGSNFSIYAKHINMLYDEIETK